MNILQKGFLNLTYSRTHLNNSLYEMTTHLRSYIYHMLT